MAQAPAYEETSRKRVAFLTKQRCERDALPLFDGVIAAGQHSVDEDGAACGLDAPCI